LSTNFQGAPGMVLCTKKWEGSWVEARKFAFLISRDTGRPCITAGLFSTAMGAEQAIGAHTDTSGQCTDAIETRVGADGPARMLHSSTESGGLKRAKCETGLYTCRIGRAEWLLLNSTQQRSTDAGV